MVVMVNGPYMGRGNQELGEKILKSFFSKLSFWKVAKKVIFYNEGVKLVVEGSPFLAELKLLEEGGVELLACGTCVDYFELGEKIRAGRVSSMDEIVDTISKADKVVTI